MNERFDPAPFDKYAQTPEEAARLDRQTKSELKAGLVGTFPASDPVSVTQPRPGKNPPRSVWAKIKARFR